MKFTLFELLLCIIEIGLTHAGRETRKLADKDLAAAAKSNSTSLIVLVPGYMYL